MTEIETAIDAPILRRKPRPHETVCIGGRTKWRLDALCRLGMRSRTATIEILIEEYLKGKPALRAAVEERANDPHVVQVRRKTLEAGTDTDTENP